MVLFFWSLFLCSVMTGILLVFLIRSLRINQERKNRYPISFLMPVAITVIFLQLTISLTIPRLLDTVNLLSKSFAIEEIIVPIGGLGWNSMTTPKHRFFYNQFEINLEDGKTYRIEFTPRSHYLVRATLVETVEISTRSIGDAQQGETIKSAVSKADASEN